MDIATGIGLIKELLGFLSNSERKRQKEEFEEIKNSILNTILSNNLFSQLSRLKTFFNRYPALLKKTENRYFYDTWLQNPLMEVQGEIPGAWTNESMSQMRSDLQPVKI
jgi:hypothetical protein